MRICLVATCVAIAAPAAADPAGGATGDRLEASAFAGGEYFPSSIGLGRSTMDNQRPQSAGLVGARLTILVAPGLAGDAKNHLDLGLEGEFAFAAASTGADATQTSYFSPVFGYRGELLVRYAIGSIRPFLVIGGGGASVRSSSPYMTRETVGEFVWGGGLSYALAAGMQVRFDVRDGILPAAHGGNASAVEGSIGLAWSFGLPTRTPPAPAWEPPPPRPAPPPEIDSDGDGIPDHIDQCPDKPETVNGIADDDGCPEPDPDGDGILGAKDRCPNEPEDFDHFQDEDGCPDPDNDHDGIPDTTDKCPNDPETFNGYQDEDGCPDALPADVGDALKAAGAVRFEAGRARLVDAAKKALDATAATLRDHPRLRITLIVHPDPGGAGKPEELARKRGNAVKGYLEDQGAAVDQIAIVIGVPATPKGPVIELALPLPAPPGAPAVPTPKQ